LTEYRDGFAECSDCQVPLIAGLPAPESDEHTLNAVSVLETSDSFALRLAKAALDDAGIDYVVEGPDPRYIAGFPGAFGVGEASLGGCSSSIRVAPEREAEARALLEPLQTPASDPSIDADSESA
jgi:hypothetical protein